MIPKLLEWVKNWEQWKKKSFWFCSIFIVLYVLNNQSFDFNKITFLGKDLWSWIRFVIVPSVVPFTVFLLGRLFQEQQQTQSINQANEDALQSYFDRCTSLLVKHKLSEINQINDELGENLNFLSAGIIRAQTLSILRRLQDDSRRKSSAVRFLIDAKIISKTQLDLSYADFSYTDLSLVISEFQDSSLNHSVFDFSNISTSFFINADLIHASFEKANAQSAFFNQSLLSHARLVHANLREADFVSADLSLADFSESDCSSANFTSSRLSFTIFLNTELVNAEFENAEFNKTILIGTNLYNTSGITYDKLEKHPDRPYICGVLLPSNVKNIDCNRDCESLTSILVSQYNYSLKESKEIIKKAKFKNWKKDKKSLFISGDTKVNS